MKLTYHNYFVETPDHNWHIHDFRPLLDNFLKIDNVEFRNSFSHGIDNLYLFRALPSIYLFVRTRHNELIKAVNSSELSCDDIYEKLKNNEKLGFASYIILRENYYGMASTFHGPTNNLWLEFLNQIIQRLGVAHHEVKSQPIMTQTTADEVVQLPFIGRTVIEFDTTNNGFFSQMASFLGYRDQNDLPEELSSFEIIIKPRLKQNIKPIFEKLAEKIAGKDGVAKFKTKAKDELGDRLSEYYIVTQGQLGDEINKGSDSSISSQIQARCESNDELVNKVQEFLQNEKVQQRQIQALVDYHAIDNFRSAVL